MKKKYYVYKMNLTCLNVFSILLFVLICSLTFFINNDLMGDAFILDNVFIFILLFLLYTIGHELLHCLSYVINGASFQNITFGCALEKGVLYCLCKQNITKSNILISLICPFLVLGVFTYVVSFIFYSKTLLLLSIFNMAGCVGDLIMFAFIRKLDNNIEYSEFDDEISFGIYSNKDISKISHFGLNYIGKNDKISRKDKRKIRISKVSVPILIIFMIMGIIDLFI